MRIIATTTLLALVIISISCARKVEIGSPIAEPVKTDISLIVSDPPAFMGDSVRVSGGPFFEGDYLRLSDSRGSEILCFPVGFEFPDSLFFKRARVEGMVFYHEEREAPAIAVKYLSGRPSGGRKAPRSKR